MRRLHVLLLATGLAVAPFASVIAAPDPPTGQGSGSETQPTTQPNQDETTPTTPSPDEAVPTTKPNADETQPTTTPNAGETTPTTPSPGEATPTAPSPDEAKPTDQSKSEDKTPSDKQSSDESFESVTVMSRARLGVLVMQLTPELREYFGAAKDSGVLVARIKEKSAAEAAGLRVGDVITSVKGTAINNATDVITALAPLKANEKVDIQVVRDHKTVALNATMRAKPQSFEKFWHSLLQPQEQPKEGSPST